MPEDFQEQQRQFNNSLKSLNKNLYNLNTHLRKQTLSHAKTRVGSLGLSGLDTGGKAATKNIGSMSPMSTGINGFDEKLY